MLGCKRMSGTACSAALLVCIAIAGCSGNREGNYRYVATSTVKGKTFELPLNIYIELKPKGIYTMTLYRQKGTGKYSITGDEITFTPALDGWGGVSVGKFYGRSFIVDAFDGTKGRWVKQ